jgi:DNA-binding MarR family transcriptional regulator
MQRDAGLSHAAYVVLAMLSEAPQRSRRMTDLARRSNQSQSRLSHTVARLEERGWVRRERAADDGRGNLAVLTDAGLDVVRSAAPGHVAAVREAMFDPLTDEQTRALGDVLEAVVDRLDPDSSQRAGDAG